MSALMFFEVSILATGALAVLLIHELGHLVAARIFGLKVSGLSVGLGPEMIGYTDRSGMRWKIGLLPVGGSCTFCDGPDPGTPHPQNSVGHRTFFGATRWQKAAIYAAGPVFNLGFAGILFLVMICGGKITGGSIAQLETHLALLIGGFSASIGLFNLLPFPPLDGGRLMLVAVEACLGRRVIEKEEKRLNTIGSSIIAGMTTASALFLFRVIG
jgi:regulator of sigma E protease